MSPFFEDLFKINPNTRVITTTKIPTAQLTLNVCL